MQALVSDGRCFTVRFSGCIKKRTKNQIKAQRSGFDLERTSSGVSELSPSGGSEGYEACEDAIGHRQKTSVERPRSAAFGPGRLPAVHPLPCGVDNLDQVHVPDPVKQELDHMNRIIEALERDLSKKVEDVYEDL